MCDIAVAVQCDWSVHLQWQSRATERLSPKRFEHVRWCSIPVRTTECAAQAMYCQVRWKVTQSVASRSAGIGTVCCRDKSTV